MKSVPPEFRDYRLLKLTNRLASELDHIPAWQLDYMLAIDEVVHSAEPPGGDP